MGKPEVKITLGRPRHRWEDNIKIELENIGCGDADWSDLTQDRN
jgi:hypothetical protein